MEELADGGGGTGGAAEGGCCAWLTLNWTEVRPIWSASSLWLASPPALSSLAVWRRISRALALQEIDDEWSIEGSDLDVAKEVVIGHSDDDFNLERCILSLASCLSYFIYV